MRDVALKLVQIIYLLMIIGDSVGYVPKTIKKGEDEYMIVVEGVKDTGNVKILNAGILFESVRWVKFPHQRFCLKQFSKTTVTLHISTL